MKRIIFYVIFLLTNLITSKQLHSQTAAPDGVIFQAVATDPQGYPAAHRTVFVKSSILQSTITGTIVYSETFQVVASANGVFTIVIGKGTKVAGPASINNIIIKKI